MNRITRIAAIALSFAAAGSAFAESPNAIVPQVSTSVASRVDVQSQAAAVTVTEADLNKTVAVASTVTREQVRAQTLDAIANGELPAVSVDTNAFAVKPAAPRLADSMHLASLGR